MMLKKKQRQAVWDKSGFWFECMGLTVNQIPQSLVVLIKGEVYVQLV